MAQDGYQIATADSSQIEARVLCALAGQEDVLQMFRDGIDTYCTLASVIYGFEVNKIDHEVERFVGKTARLGLGFGMGGPKFCDTMRSGSQGPKVDMRIEEANHIVYDVFRPTHRDIVDLWGAANEAWLPHMLMGVGQLHFGPLIIERGNILLPNGMRLHYPNLRYDPDPRSENRGQWTYFDGKMRVKIYGGKLVENVVQALARIIILYMGLEIDEWLLMNKAGKVVHSVHDETVAAVLKELVAEYEAATTEIMRRPPIWMPNLPLDLEIKVGPRYEK
jgi:DNA polymerase